MKVKFKTSLNGLLFAAAETFDVMSFREIVEKMKALNNEAGKYIEDIDPKKSGQEPFSSSDVSACNVEHF